MPLQRKNHKQQSWTTNQRWNSRVMKKKLMSIWTLTSNQMLLHKAQLVSRLYQTGEVSPRSLHSHHSISENRTRAKLHRLSLYVKIKDCLDLTQLLSKDRLIGMQIDINRLVLKIFQPWMKPRRIRQNLPQIPHLQWLFVVSQTYASTILTTASLISFLNQLSTLTTF